jgi:hypothetical protein
MTKTKQIEYKKAAYSRLGTAIAELNATYKTSEDKKAIRASVNGLALVQKEIKASIDELESDLALEEEPLLEEEDEEVLDDLSEDDALDEEEQTLAIASLSMARNMLLAALEGEDEGASEEDSEDEESSEDDELEEDSEDEESSEDDELEEEDDSLEDSEDEEDMSTEEEDMDVEEEEPSEEEASDEEAGSEEEEDAEVLSSDELDALQAEGLLDASTRVRARLAALAAAIPSFEDEEEILDEEEELEADEMPADYYEDGEEAMTSAEFLDVLGTFSRDERKQILDAPEVVSAKKITEADRRKMEKSAKKNRKLRSFRSEWKKSATGKKGVVRLPDGKTRKVRKKFYFSTYDSKGNFLGTMWFLKNRVNKSTQDNYKAKHNVKHPSLLPAKNDKAIAAKKPKPKKK